MFNTNSGYSLADVAAATGNGANTWGGDGGAWWIIILFLFCFMGGGFGWNNGTDRNYVTSEDMQNQFNFASLERQNNEITANSRQMAYDISDNIAKLGYSLNSVIRDANSDLKENVRDNQALIQNLSSTVESCCCSTNRNIDSVRYDAALNTREIMKNDCDNTQKILDAISGNRMADMQNQINQLQLQSALSGVVRYPLATTYSAGFAPLYGGGCNCGTSSF